MKIGLIGTGLMGFPMAEKILENNFELWVYNRSVEKALPLQKKGAIVATRIDELIENTDTIIFMLSDYAAIKSILYQSEVESRISEKTVLQMGTISPSENREIEEFCIKNSSNFLEVPVLGSINEVKNRKLIIFAGGELHTFKKYIQLFEIFGDYITYIGSVGKASALKLALNQLIVSLTAAFSVSLSYIQKNEINVETFMDIVRKSAVYAPTYDKKLSNYENKNFDKTNFPLQLMLKDVHLIKDEAEKSAIDSGLLQAIEAIISKTLERGYKNKDYSSLYMGIYEK